MTLLRTTVVGSYPQPGWLIDRERLATRPPPRALASELWRVAPAFLEEAQDDATIVAIRDMERAGIDLVTVSPKLDLRMFVDHAVLGDYPPVYDVSRVLLDGSLRTNTNTEQLEVLSGTFAFETTPASYGFSASTGECVTGTEAYDDSSGSFYTEFSVGACP